MDKETNLPVKLAIDIGTTKICAILSVPDKTKQAIEILGVGVAESEGLNRGVVVNIDKTVKAIRKAVEQAEQQSGLKSNKVTVGIAGDHIQSTLSHHIISVSNPQKEITKEEVDRLIKEASKIPLSLERKIIHLFPQEYIIDGQDGVIEPIGMSGVRMEAKIHIVTGMATAIDNIYKCINRAGLEVEELILEPLASSYAVLSEDEKEVGVALIDIGGGTTDIAIFVDNVIKYTDVIALGGSLLTDDVRRVLNIVKNEAERIKREYGHCYLNSLHKDDILQIPPVGGRTPKEIKKSDLVLILQSRMTEILKFVNTALINSGFKDQLGAGVVITGGTTLLTGIDELAEEVLSLPVKIGIPTGISSKGLAPEVENPIFATGVGLALYSFRNYFQTEESFEENKNETEQNIETKMSEEQDLKNKIEEKESVEEIDENKNLKEEKSKKKKKEKSQKTNILDKVKEIFEQF
ncbi:MAG: cell division protein FtsA [Candidatus Kapaibacteriota bacterium]